MQTYFLFSSISRCFFSSASLERRSANIRERESDDPREQYRNRIRKKGIKYTHRFHAGDVLPPPSFSAPISSPRPREWSCASLASPVNNETVDETAMKDRTMVERDGRYGILCTRSATNGDSWIDLRIRTFNLFSSSSSLALCFRHSAMYSLSCSSRSLLFCSCLCVSGKTAECKYAPPAVSSLDIYISCLRGSLGSLLSPHLHKLDILPRLPDVGRSENKSNSL